MTSIFSYVSCFLILAPTSTAFANEQTLGSWVVTSDDQNLTLRFPFPELYSSIVTDALLCGSQSLPAATQVTLVSPSNSTQTIQANIVSAKCLELKRLALSSAGTYTVKTDRAEFVFEAPASPSLSNVSIFSTRIEDGTHGVLQFATKTLSGQTTEAVFCLGSLGTVVGASLWMPDMGHGSSPVTLISQTNGCTKISKMDFFMTGAWDVRVTLANNSRFVFGVEIK